MGSDNNVFVITNEVVNLILKKKPMHRKFLMRAISNLALVEKQEVEDYLSFLIQDEMEREYIADAYLTIVNDTFLEELRFRETGNYRFSSFAEAQEVVYDNHDYMSRYMIGLALSSFWWSNHTKMRRFFQQQLSGLSQKSGLYREIGPGHGMYFLESLRHGNFKKYEGIDISSTSVEMTRKIVNSSFFGSFPNVEIIHGDFLDGTELVPADVLVMGEVLEHVENPGAFLQRAYQTTSDDSFFFMTTCINAPAIDHLYNPGSIENLESLFADYGFFVQDRCIVPRDGATLEDCVNDRLAINVAYVLVKRK